jgi:predicted AlkP superfamily phosphohydrolase/phosphomutase
MRSFGLTTLISRNRLVHLGKRLLGKMGVDTGKVEARDFIDWQRSKVFAVPVYNNFMGICINTRGEKKLGTVSPGSEYESVKNEVIARLEALVDPDTGEKLVKAIHPRETLYRGPLMDQTPDMVVQFSYDHQVQFGPFKRVIVEKKVDLTRTGDHRMEGIFIAAGTSAKSGSVKRNLYIQDVTSTLLHLMDTPIPETYDGEIIREVFSESDLAQRPPRYLSLEETLGLKPQETDPSRRDEHEQSKALLESLGYM